MEDEASRTSMFEEYVAKFSNASRRTSSLFDSSGQTSDSSSSNTSIKLAKVRNMIQMKRNKQDGTGLGVWHRNVHFSTGGRILDSFRSSLTPKLVQAVICLQDWRRNEPYPVNVEEDFNDLMKLELDMIDSSKDSLVLDL